MAGILDHRLPDDAVAVSIEAVGLSPLDLIQLRGNPATTARWQTSGFQMAGEVVQAGESVNDLQTARRVAGFVEAEEGVAGQYPDRVVTKAANVVPVPDSVNSETAAAIPIAYGTALYALEKLAELEEGQSVVVLSSGHGMGTAAVQLAKLLGARTFAAAALSGELEAFRAHADEVIDYSSQNLTHRLLEVTANDGIDVIYDLTDGVHAKQALRATAAEGRCILLDWVADEEHPLPRSAIRERALRVAGMFWPIYFNRHNQVYRRDLSRCLEWCAEGRLKPYIQATYGMREARAALDLLRAEKASGTLVLKKES